MAVMVVVAENSRNNQRKKRGTTESKRNGEENEMSTSRKEGRVGGVGGRATDSTLPQMIPTEPYCRYF